MDLVPRDHLVHFIRDLVREELDLSAIFDAYRVRCGYPPYHPGLMTALLLYSYSRGIYSSRRIERACEERVDYMALTGMAQPVSTPKTVGGAGVRSDQGGPRLSTLPAPRSREGDRGVVPAVHGPQPSQAGGGSIASRSLTTLGLPTSRDTRASWRPTHPPACTKPSAGSLRSSNPIAFSGLG